MSEGKASKGSVGIESSRNRLRLRLPRSLYEGKQRYIGLELDDTPENRARAEKYRAMAEWDIKYDEFDWSHQKYKPPQASSPVDPVAQRMEANHRKAVRRLEADMALLDPVRSKPLLPLWDQWVETLDLSARTANVHYASIRAMIHKSADEATTQNHEWFTQYSSPNGEPLSARTWNDRLTYLRSFGQWMQDRGITQKNVYADLKSKKGKKQEIEPFTLEEMSKIINAFRTNQFSSKYSPVKHSHYADYVYFLFATGCRPSETIGLQWRHIDFEKETIKINSVLARDDQGRTSGKHRVRKETKTGSIKILSCKNDLKAMLLDRKPENCNPDALVFPSPDGLAIDDKNFRNRQWKVVLDGLEIDYRKPYTTRHTLISHAIEQGMPLTQVAYLAGHKDTRMVMTTYGHMINRPDLPDLGI